MKPAELRPGQDPQTCSSQDGRRGNTGFFSGVLPSVGRTHPEDHPFRSWAHPTLPSLCCRGSGFRATRRPCSQKSPAVKITGPLCPARHPGHTPNLGRGTRPSGLSSGGPGCATRRSPDPSTLAPGAVPCAGRPARLPEDPAARAHSSKLLVAPAPPLPVPPTGPQSLTDYER